MYEEEEESFQRAREWIDANLHPAHAHTAHAWLSYLKVDPKPFLSTVQPALEAEASLEDVEIRTGMVLEFLDALWSIDDLEKRIEFLGFAIR